MRRPKSTDANAPSVRDDAASVATFLRHGGPHDGFELASVMTWQRRRVDKALAVLVSESRVTIDANTGKYSLVHDDNLNT
jgi:hypothetical protein